MPSPNSDPRNSAWNNSSNNHSSDSSYPPYDPQSSSTPSRTVRQVVFRRMPDTNNNRHESTSVSSYNMMSPNRADARNNYNHMDVPQQFQQQTHHGPYSQAQSYYKNPSRSTRYPLTSSSSENRGPPPYSNDYHSGMPTMPTLREYPHASSFESANSSGPVPQIVPSGPSYMGPYPAYPYGPYGYHPQYYGGGGGGAPPPWGMAPVPQVEYIVDIVSEDVLSGRGGATNSHSGNRAFRSLVKEYQPQYLQAKKRDKPAVASIIVELIREKGGRFLRRCDTNPQGKVLWVDIGDERAREKTCQALREGAPELRRRKKVGSSDEDEVEPTDSPKGTEATTLTSASSMERTLSSEKTETNTRSWVYGGDSDAEESRDGSGLDGSIVIRPLARLMPRRPPVDPMPLDQLSDEYRELYLRDFLPPCPQIRKKRKLSNRSHYDGSVDRNAPARPNEWPVVSV